jgi:transcriptional regulator with XRE-family HTH domain
MFNFVNIRDVRNFRLKYHISLKELAAEMGTTQQWLSQVELGKASTGLRCNKRLARALQGIVNNRKDALSQMEIEFSKIKGNLLQGES